MAEAYHCERCVIVKWQFQTTQSDASRSVACRRNFLSEIGMLFQGFISLVGGAESRKQRYELNGLKMAHSWHGHPYMLPSLNNFLILVCPQSFPFLYPCD